MVMKRWSLVCCLFCSLLLTGCAVRLLYNWLDWAISWKMDDYFSLSRQQSRLLDDEVQNILKWHRKNALPRYVNALRTLSFDLRHPLSEREVEYHVGVFEALLKELAEGLKEPANRFAASLTDEQIASFMAERLSKQAKLRKEWQENGAADVHDDFVRKLKKNMENWLGEIDPSQEPLIQTWADWQQKYYPNWLDYQDVWLQAMGNTLKARGTPAFEPELVQVLIKGRELGDGKFIRYVDASRQLSIRWFSQLSASLTDEQRKHLRGRLSELASDLDALSKN